MDAEVLLQFRYLDSNEQGSSKAFISSDKQTVWNLKLLIQEIINAPACDVKVFFQGRQLQIASLPLSNLYLRDGDVLEVEATAKIDIQSLRRVTLELKNFEDRINKGENSFEDCTNEDDLELTYSNVEQALNTITDQYFAPWNTATAAANRHFFVQEGGFAALMALLRYSQQHPCGLTSEPKIQRFMARRSDRKTFQNHQQLQLRLQAECFSLLWRFMVKAEDRKYVVDNGAMELILCGLMLESEAHPGADNRWNFMLSWKTVNVNQQALGCLAGCVEYDKHAQEIVASDSATVDKLLDMMHKNSKDNVLYRLFFSLVVANTLFYLTFSPKALKKLTDDNLYLKLIPLTEKFLNTGNIDPSAGDMDTDLDDDDVLHLGYYLCLILARMLASPSAAIDESTTHTINTLINSCLSKITPTAIATLEEMQSYVWVTLVPLVHLAFAGGLGMSTENNVRRGITSSTGLNECDQPASRVVTMESPDSETEAKSPLGHRLGKSGSFPDLEHPSYLLAKNVSPCGEACSAASNCERILEDCFSTNKFPGSWSVQQLGIFSIQHLLYSSANRQLLLLEGLLPYLICLSWQLQREDKRKLEQELNKFDDIEPPSLKVAAKSILARLHGFETVFYTM